MALKPSHFMYFFQIHALKKKRSEVLLIKWTVLHYNTYKSDCRKMEKLHHPSRDREDELLLCSMGGRQVFAMSSEHWIPVKITFHNHIWVTPLMWHWTGGSQQTRLVNFSVKVTSNLACSWIVMLVILLSSFSFIILDQKGELHHTWNTVQETQDSAGVQWTAMRMTDLNTSPVRKD